MLSCVGCVICKRVFAHLLGDTELYVFLYQQRYTGFEF